MRNFDGALEDFNRAGKNFSTSLLISCFQIFSNGMGSLVHTSVDVRCVLMRTPLFPSVKE